ncbi:hypothetical protein B7P34_10840 [Streptosporangium nondiastaticum]|uniref:Uncharacterized protein n=1 Tax=Streptosporangium nondiastaticum TaxID=35764 RepID=A0A9X7PI40_9ACTN|nr:hypothetical protein [Streptosporangium nondiastaticum]PSJ28779.1 hypothetical protein B7P34_10840 [Streptosporangium nondiastaticum]
MRLPRIRNLLIPLLGAFTTLMATAGAAAADDKFKKYKPAGIGDLLKTPRIGEGSGSTLYEQYGSGLYYRLDSELGWKDIGWSMLNGIADIFMGLTVFITQSAVVAVQWTLNLTDVKEIHDAITTAISSAGGTVSETLLPSALAVGAMVAWANHRKASGSGLSQLGWVAASGILAVSLVSTPGVWVDGIDSVRKVGSSIAMEATSAGMNGNAQEPFAVKGNPDLDQNDKKDSEETKKNKLVRKSTDAIWRSYVVTPWCIAEFGNLDTCKEFGEQTLQKTDKPPKDDDFADARREFLSKTLSDSKIGIPAMKWRQGKNAGRVTVTIAAFVCAALFALLAVALAFASLASLIGALMLLLAGVVFACLWVIPGRPRQWGMRWFDALLGFALQSFVSTMVLGVVLVLNTVSISMLGKYGYFAAIGVSITSAIVAFKFRAVMESIVGVTGALSPGASAAGMALGRGASRLAGRMVGKPAGWAGRQAARPVKWAGRKTGQAAWNGTKWAGRKSGQAAWNGTKWAGRKTGQAAMSGGAKVASAGAEQLHKAKERGLQALATWAADNPPGTSARMRSSDGQSTGSRRADGSSGAGRTIATLPERRTASVGSVRPRNTPRAGQPDLGRIQVGAAHTGRATGAQNRARRHPQLQAESGQNGPQFRPARGHNPPPRQKKITQSRRAANSASVSGGAASRRSGPAKVNRSVSAPAAPASDRRRRRRNS